MTVKALQRLADTLFRSLPGNETLVNEPAPGRQLQLRSLTLSLVTQP